jgi:hypothetical protein
MAKTILRDCRIEINGVVLSDHANEVEVSSEKEEQDVTGFGASSREIALGLGDGTIDVTLFQDFDAASVDATLWPIHNGSTSVVVAVRPTSAAISATNPEYRMTGVLPAYTPLSGSVGEPSTISASFRNASQAGITRVTA